MKKADYWYQTSIIQYFDDALFVLIAIYSHSVVVIVVVVVDDDDEPLNVFNPISLTRHLTHQRCSNAYRTGIPSCF